MCTDRPEKVNKKEIGKTYKRGGSNGRKKQTNKRGKKERWKQSRWKKKKVA
jgi:hypothetical protein